tara:strand:+ start:900 stop:1736 length:837 start_codon:yes stop_codon:yes gene_type:complete
MTMDGQISESDSIVVANNTGIGDAIVMNGSVRYLASKYNKVYLVCWDSRFKHIEFMYRDNDRIIPFVKPHPSSTRQARLRQESAYRKITEENPSVNFPPLRRCYFNKESEWLEQARRLNLPNDVIWPHVFYAVQGVPYGERYKSYFLLRDLEREDSLFETLKLPKKYAFVVRDSRKYRFDFKPPTSLPVVDPTDHPWQDTLIFDWIKVIKNASEIHTVDTSWMHLVRMCQVDVPKFYWAERDLIMTGDGYLNDNYDFGWTRVKSREGSHVVKNNYWLK